MGMEDNINVTESVKGIALVMKKYADDVKNGKRTMSPSMEKCMENHFWDMI